MTTGSPTIPERGPRLLTPDEVAEILRVSKTTIYRIVERRVLRFYRISGSLRFALADVEEYLRQGCVEPVVR
jgi:excisionase family DNA binding protein